MIPKIIHYCWFGNNEKNNEVLQYIETWKKLLPDFQIKEWNESNFDVDTCKYTREAYDAGKYAFVSDYVRLFALYQEGGVYLDTDIEVKKDFSNLLNGKRTVLGYEDQKFVLTAFMASEPKQEWVKNLLDKYNSKRFILDNGKYDTLPNPVIVTDELRQWGLKSDGERDDFSEGISIYPFDYFSAYHVPLQKILPTPNTYMIHHCMGTWQTKREKIKPWVKSKLVRLFGEDTFEKIKRKFYKGYIR